MGNDDNIACSMFTEYVYNKYFLPWHLYLEALFISTCMFLKETKGN